MSTQQHCGVRRGPPRTIRRNATAGQLRSRNAYRECTNFWKTEVTAANRQKWENYADRHIRFSLSGKPFYMTAYNAFLHMNLYRARTGVFLWSSPPDD